MDPGALSIVLAFTAFAAIGAVAGLLALAMRRADEANLRRLPPPVTSKQADRIAQKRAEVAARRASQTTGAGEPPDVA
jgi:hypothetical protein